MTSQSLQCRLQLNLFNTSPFPISLAKDKCIIVMSIVVLAKGISVLVQAHHFVRIQFNILRVAHSLIYQATYMLIIKDARMKGIIGDGEDKRM